MDKYIWYCSYGSNLLFDRFRLYIEGGEAGFVDKTYQGCSDKTLPKKSEGYILPHELYFSQHFAPWENKGVAFITHAHNKGKHTYSRIYEVTVDQFKEIVQQENGNPADASKIDIDFQTLYKTGSVLIGSPDENRWYGKLICAGQKDNLPIITFTAKWDIHEVVPVLPGKKYLSTIIRGLKETFPGKGLRLYDYLQSLEGIRKNYSLEDLKSLIEENE